MYRYNTETDTERTLLLLTLAGTAGAFSAPIGSEQDEYDQVGHHRMVVNEADRRRCRSLHFNGGRSTNTLYGGCA